MCLTHGKKATKKLKPSWTTEVGPDGTTRKKYVKKTFWVCDVGMLNGKILTQTRLPFTRTTVGVKRGGDTAGGVACIEFSSTTAGQPGEATVQTGMR